MLSNNDGMVVASSREAKTIGLDLGKPWFELRGVACIGPEEDRTGKKDQLIVSRSGSEKVTTVAGIRQAL